MRILWLSVFIFILDQVTKQIIRLTMDLGDSFSVLGEEFFRITYVENPGMAFGIDPGNKLLFSLLTIVIVLGLCYYMYTLRHESLSQRLPMAVVLGGAFGNLVDRVFYGLWFQEQPLLFGRVVDFMDFDFPDIDLWGFYMSRWPVFNVADMAVSTGVILMLIFMKNESPDTEKTDSEPQTPPVM